MPHRGGDGSRDAVEEMVAKPAATGMRDVDRGLTGRLADAWGLRGIQTLLPRKVGVSEALALPYSVLPND
jgi:hypothetical protein